MNKKNLFLIAGSLSMIIPSCRSEKHALSESKPNIVYILADDLGYAELGCYGQTKIETPNIDKLAQNGIRFTWHYSGSPVCAPSRCTLMTGKHTGHAYIRGNDEWDERGDVWNYEAMVKDSSLEGQRPIPDSILTVGELLQRAGYKTAIVGKWGLGAPGTEGVPNKQGFDFFCGYNCQRLAHTYYPVNLWVNDHRIYLGNDTVAPGTKLDPGADPYDAESYKKFNLKTYSPDVMLSQALKFLDDCKDKPFFLYYPTTIPHVALQAPERWVKYYEKKFGPEEPFTENTSYFPVRTPHATYAAMVSYLDEQVGEIVQKLKDLDAYDNTLIIFTSDNGPAYNAGHDSQYFQSAAPFNSDNDHIKGHVDEGGIHVPMIASWPGHIKQGTESSHLSAFWDVMPTLCDVAGVKAPDNIDGISFLPAMTGKGKQSEHEYLYWEIPEYDGQQAVRMGKWKAFRKDMNKGNMEIALFDLSHDPMESNNLADLYPEVVEKIKTIMTKAHTAPALKRFEIEGLE